MKNQVHEKGYRNKPLTEEQKASNHEKSKNRARVEHVFAKYVGNDDKSASIEIKGNESVELNFNLSVTRNSVSEVVVTAQALDQIKAIS
jgi:hypothetical protein